MVPNLNTYQIKSYYPPSCNIPTILSPASSRISTLRDLSFAVCRSHLFNTLPQHLRDITNVELPVEFKKELDKFLATVPDEPPSPGYTEICRAESNSLINMV